MPKTKAKAKNVEPLVEWVYASRRGRVVHVLKKDTHLTDADPELRETVCGKLVYADDLREAVENSVKCMKCYDRVSPERSQLPVVTYTEMLTLDKAKVQKIEGYVYCVTHGAIHEDTLDPFWEQDATCLTQSNGTGIGVTKDDVHRSVFIRWKIGDYPDAGV